MQTAKKHIIKIVEKYKLAYPEDFETVKDAIALKRNGLLNDWGQAEGSDMRALFEIPVELSEMLIMGLSEEEMEWFKAGGRDRKEGARWFATHFPVFRLTKTV